MAAFSEKQQDSYCTSSQEEEFFAWLWGEGCRLLEASVLARALLQGRVFDVILGDIAFSALALLFEREREHEVGWVHRRI